MAAVAQANPGAQQGVPVNLPLPEVHTGQQTLIVTLYADRFELLSDQAVVLSDSAVALALVDVGNIHCVFCDMGPLTGPLGASGFRLARALKASRAELPVYLMTDSLSGQDPQLAASFCAAGIIRRDPRHVRATLERLAVARQSVQAGKIA